MPMLPDDTALLQAWRSHHEEAAFRELCARHVGMVAGACRRMGSPDADEAVQAVFLVLAQRAGSVDGASLASWLGSTVRRVVANQRRGAASRRQHEQEAAVEYARQHQAASTEPVWDEARRHLDEALASLSVGRREAVVRFFLEGRPHAEVAAELGCSVEAARTRVHEGMERLRIFFARRGVVLGVAALASGLSSEIAAAEPALVASCTQSVCASVTAPGAVALASGVTSGVLSQTAAMSVLMALLVVIGGLATWRMLEVTHGPAPVQPLISSSAHVTATVAPTEITPLLIAEDFEDEDFRLRGWYDNPQFMLTSVEHAPGSTQAAEFRFLRGAEEPIAGEPRRRLFPPSEAIRITYWIKYGPTWTVSAPLGCVSQLCVLTTEDGQWDAPTFTHLTCTIGTYQGVPYISLRDGRNIDVNHIGQDLVGLTEERAIAGGNGAGDSHGPGDCFTGQDGRFWNSKLHLVTDAAMTDHPGPFFAGEWHHIEIRLCLNRIVDEKSIPDGRLAYLVDGQLVLDRTNVLFRTAQHADMRFNQLIIASWFQDGSPQDQTFWMDDLTLSVNTDQPTLPLRGVP